MRFLRFLTLSGLGLLAACNNAGEKLTIPKLPTGIISATVFLDRDGSKTYTSDDTLFAGARVALLVAGGHDTVRVATTNQAGVAVFDSVPVGAYHIAVDRLGVGDSIGVFAGDTGSFRILARADSAVSARLLRLGYNEVTIAEARALPAGRRVMLRAIVLSPLQAFRDSSAFVSDPTGFIRVTSARHRPGRAGNNFGDSVLVLGTTGALLGQPVLVAGLFGTLGEKAPPAALTVSVLEAHTAKGGTLDAALVQITGAKINDTIQSDPDFLVRLADAADVSKKTDVLVDQFLAAPHFIFGIGLTFSVRGVLVPKGDGTWVIKPRGGLDIVIGP